MAKVTDTIQNSNETLFSIEVLPPSKGQNVNSYFEAIDPLMEFKPCFIDVTYHREEHIYIEKDNGLLEKVVLRKRPGTVGVCAAIKERYNIDPVPHVICGGFTAQEIENILIDLQFLGIENVVALRGDANKSEGKWTPTEGGHSYASELVEQIVNLNNGIYLYEQPREAYPTDFCIGVAGYPEKHFEAPNMDYDFQYLKEKIRLGGEYIVTQMFFDNQAFFSFVRRCRAEGINVPIIPGLKPLTTKKQLTILPSIFHMDIPEELSKEVEQAKDNKQVREIGVEWCIQQSKELKEFGVPVLHYYSMSRSKGVKAVAEALF